MDILTLPNNTRKLGNFYFGEENLSFQNVSRYPELLDLLYHMQCEEHRPPTAGLKEGPSKMSLMMSPGAQMALLTVNNSLVPTVSSRAVNNSG